MMCPFARHTFLALIVYLVLEKLVFVVALLAGTQMYSYDGQLIPTRHVAPLAV